MQREHWKFPTFDSNCCECFLQKTMVGSQTFLLSQCVWWVSTVRRGSFPTGYRKSVFRGADVADCFRMLEVNIESHQVVCGLEHVLFSHILGIIIPTGFHIIKRGWNMLKPPTSQGLWCFHHFNRSDHGAHYAQCFPIHAIMMGHDDQSAHISGMYSNRQPGTSRSLSALSDSSTKGMYIYIYTTSSESSVESLVKTRSWSRAKCLSALKCQFCKTCRLRLNPMAAESLNILN